MATTNTLSADTLVSSLTLTDGDTIQLAGYNIIWDADTRATGVTIANSGAASHFECRNGGAVKLNASLPSNVHPWGDPANPLPESNYTAGLTANASFEFQLSGGFSLGGGAASLPTATRTGEWYAKATAFPTPSSITFDRDLPLHAGDVLSGIGVAGGEVFTVSDYDPSTFTATATATIQTRTVGHYWFISSGGVCVNKISNDTGGAISSDIVCGTLTIVQKDNYGAAVIVDGVSGGVNIVADRLTARAVGNAHYANSYYTLFSAKTNAIISQVGTWAALFPTYANGNYIIGKAASARFCPSVSPEWYSNIIIGGGILPLVTIGYFFGRAQITFKGCDIPNAHVAPRNSSVVRYLSSKISGTEVPNMDVCESGTITQTHEEIVGHSWFHAPAASADTTWRYEDYAVKPHSTLRIRVFWKRGENSSASARAAITDTANWYAGTQCGALAETVFPASQNDGWQEARIEWRNTSDEDEQVRVWETVAGDTAGGYLRTLVATGGPM